MVDESKIFVSEAGPSYKLKRINRVLLDAVGVRVKREWADAGEPVDVPTFTTSGSEAGEQTFQHRVTEKGNTLDIKDDPEQTRINHLAWDAHIDALGRLEAAQQEEKTRAVFTFGIECEPPEDGEWLAMLEMAGVDVPDDAPGRRFAYLWYYALSMSDKQQLIPTLEMISLGRMVKPEMMELFRRRIASSLDGAAGGVIDDAFAALDDAFDTGGELDGEPDVPGGTDSESVADPVG